MEPPSRPFVLEPLDLPSLFTDLKQLKPFHSRLSKHNLSFQRKQNLLWRLTSTDIFVEAMRKLKKSEERLRRLSLLDVLAYRPRQTALMTERRWENAVKVVDSSIRRVFSANETKFEEFDENVFLTNFSRTSTNDAQLKMGEDCLEGEKKGGEVLNETEEEEDYLYAPQVFEELYASHEVLTGNDLFSLTSVEDLLLPEETIVIESSVPFLFDFPSSESIDDQSPVSTYFLPFALKYLPNRSRSEYFRKTTFHDKESQSQFEFSVVMEETIENNMKKATVATRLFIIQDGFLFEFKSRADVIAGSLPLGVVPLLELSICHSETLSSFGSSETNKSTLQIELQSSHIGDSVQPKNTLRSCQSSTKLEYPLLRHAQHTNGSSYRSTLLRTDRMLKMNFSSNNLNSSGNDARSSVPQSPRKKKLSHHQLSLKSHSKIKVTFQALDSSQAAALSLFRQVLETQVNHLKQHSAPISSLNHPDNEIRRRYDYDPIADVLGKGKFSVVYRATCKRTNSKCAIKVIDKPTFWDLVEKRKEKSDTISREVAINIHLNQYPEASNYFVSVHKVLDLKKYLILEMDLIEGNDLFHCLKDHTRLQENDAKEVMKTLVHALLMMKKLKVAHRDLKLSNIVLDADKDGLTVPKIIDFGLAVFEDENGKISGRCGTPGYIAPEILNASVIEEYDNVVDAYSLGVVFFTLLTGSEPFQGRTERELVLANRKAELAALDYDKHGAFWRKKKVSIETVALLREILYKDPSKRIGLDEILSHPAFASPCFSIAEGLDEGNEDCELNGRQDGDDEKVEETTQAMERSSFMCAIC